MKNPVNVLIFGASYGSLLATKIVLAGHHATMVCTPAEAELFNKEGAVVRLPPKLKPGGRQDLIEVNSRKLSGKLAACTPADARTAGVDLVVLGMQEPQYRSPGVRELLEAVARAKLPCMSIMNIPPCPISRAFRACRRRRCATATPTPASGTASSRS